MAEPPCNPFIVQAPFDTDSLGDCILRTSDGTEFKVLRAILSMASSIFRDMFDMPTETINETKDTIDLPVVEIEEDAETVQTLLQMLYPIDPPPINSLNLAGKLITAFDKYFISMAKLRFHLRGLFSDDQVLKQDPILSYSLLWKLGWTEEARRASRYTHALDLMDKAIAGPIVALSGDVEAFLMLLRLRTLREKALDTLLSLVGARKFGACSLGHKPSQTLMNDEGPRRAHLTEALKEPYPDCEDIEAFLGFRTEPGASGCIPCQEGQEIFLCSIRATTVAALRSYPQGISHAAPRT